MSADDIAERQMRFAEALRTGQTRSLAEFVSWLEPPPEVQELARLASVEIEFRRSKGESVKLSDFFGRFPQLVAIENEQTVGKVQNEGTTGGTELFPDQLTDRTRQIINIGETLDDFQLLAELGRGSFATVFLARQVSMQRLVALKVSVDHGMEAQTLAQLDHPHIVRVFDQRKAREHDLQLLYMQYLDGGTLLDAAQKVFNQNPLPPLSGRVLVQAIDRAIEDRGSSPNYESGMRKHFLVSNWDQTVCRIGFYLAEALDYAHRKGVLHRDIKPANVLIGSDCCVKLADFNISSSEHVVGKGNFGGSLAYMSPEQIRAFNREDAFSAEELDARCDTYSLGVMLIQLLKGRLPFSSLTKSRTGEGLQAMVFERENSSQHVAEMLSGHSKLMQTALQKCVRADREDRHASAQELATQLRIGLDAEAEKLLYPASGNWTTKFRRHFYLVCIAVALILNGLAALFVYDFNRAAVPANALEKFQWIQAIVNGIAFPLAIVAFACLTRPAVAALRTGQRGGRLSPSELKVAMSRSLAAGHIQATICGAEWLIAGIAYPILLTISGFSLNRSVWFYFIASHALAGIAITTLTFFAMTWLTLRIWFPVLVQHSFAREVVHSSIAGLQALKQRISIYQLLAVSVPLLAMALLALFDEIMSLSKSPLRVISMFGLLTIPIVLFGGNRIRAICERLLLVFRAND